MLQAEQAKLDEEMAQHEERMKNATQTDKLQKTVKLMTAVWKRSLFPGGKHLMTAFWKRSNTTMVPGTSI